MFKSKPSGADTTSPRLEKLFNSLITIILSYTNKAERSHVFKNSTLDALENDILSRPTSIWRTDRTSLMLYILSTIHLLRPHIQSPKVLNEDETNNLKIKLINFIINLQKIVSSSNSVEIDVLIDGRHTFIEGCGTWRSVSGDIIKKNVFIALAIPTQGSEYVIRQYITDLLNEQQNPLLLRKIESLKSINQSKEEKYLSIRHQLIGAEEENNRLLQLQTTTDGQCKDRYIRSQLIFTSPKEEVKDQLKDRTSVDFHR